MSRPGDPGRQQYVADGFDEIVATTAQAVGTIPGARSFELRYDGVDRVLADDEEPRTDERIRWTAIATIRARHGSHRFDREVKGTAIAEPGNHGRGMSMACVELLEKLGANVVLVDQSDDAPDRPDPEGGG